LENLIKKVQYELPECEDDTVMEIGNEPDKKKIIKIVYDSTSYILKKCDYIVFNKKSPQKYLKT